MSEQTHPMYGEWRKTVSYLADRGYWATYYALVEAGPENDINYAKLRDEK